MIGLAWERVDLERRVARLPKTKNGDAREVALSARAAELLRLLPAARPFTISRRMAARMASFTHSPSAAMLVVSLILRPP